MRLWAGVLPFLFLLVPSAAAAQQARLLDDFSRPANWRATASDGVTASAAPFEGGLALDYDFSRGSGYAVLRRELPLDLPENFEPLPRSRAGAANALKSLVDPRQQCLWHCKRIRAAGRMDNNPRPPPPDRIRPGPAEDHSLRRTAAIDRRRRRIGRGRGWIAIDDLT